MDQDESWLDPCGPKQRRSAQRLECGRPTSTYLIRPCMPLRGARHARRERPPLAPAACRHSLHPVSGVATTGVALSTRLEGGAPQRCTRCHPSFPTEIQSAPPSAPAPAPHPRPTCSYWADIGHKQSDDAGSSRRFAVSPGAGIALGVCLSVVLVLVAALLTHLVGRPLGGVRFAGAKIGGNVSPPLYSPFTTLVITDIADSTRLWEALPDEIMVSGRAGSVGCRLPVCCDRLCTVYAVHARYSHSEVPTHPHMQGLPAGQTAATRTALLRAHVHSQAGAAGGQAPTVIPF